MRGACLLALIISEGLLICWCLSREPDPNVLLHTEEESWCWHETGFTSLFVTLVHVVKAFVEWQECTGAKWCTFELHCPKLLLFSHQLRDYVCHQWEYGHRSFVHICRYFLNVSTWFYDRFLCTESSPCITPWAFVYSVFWDRCITHTVCACFVSPVLKK